MLSLEGREIGGCKLIRKIGEGGMGLVYLAEQLDAGNRLVAVKIVRAGDASFSNAGADVVRRFKREAALLKNLSYPNILPIYGSGVEDDLLYIITPYAQAGSLSDAMRGRSAIRLQLPAPLDLTVDIISQVASALQYCHDRGIIHRDVKPGNVLIQIEPSGHWRMLLADFGVARPEQTTTAQTMVTGTFAYMAPEQFTAQFSPASDQYALAVMTYQLLAGRVPFEGDLIALSQGHLYEDPPSLRAINPNVPPGVERVIRRALSKDPENRYPTVELFAEALQATAAGVPYEQSPGADLRPRRNTPPPPAQTPAPRNAPSKPGRAPSWPVDLAPPKRRSSSGRILVALLAAVILFVGLLVAPGVLNARQQQINAQQTAAAQTASARVTKTGTTPTVGVTQTIAPTVTPTATLSPTATPQPVIPTATATAGLYTDMGSPPPSPSGTGAQQFADPSPRCDSPPIAGWQPVGHTTAACVAAGGIKVTANAAPQLGAIEQQTVTTANNYVDVLVAPGSTTQNVALGFRLSGGSSGATSAAPSAGYYFEVNPTAGTYTLLKVDGSGAGTTIDSGPVDPSNPGKPLAAHFALGATFKGGSIALYVNGNQIATKSDSSYTTGVMGLCTDGNATFKDAQIFAFS
jgi:serine/threonine protein kinase